MERTLSQDPPCTQEGKSDSPDSLNPIDTMNWLKAAWFKAVWDILRGSSTPIASEVSEPISCSLVSFNMLR